MGISNRISSHIIDFDLPGNPRLEFAVRDVVGKDGCTEIGFYFDTQEQNYVAGSMVDYEFAMSKTDAKRLRDKLDEYLKGDSE
jgi:hypothetical protein